MASQRLVKPLEKQKARSAKLSLMPTTTAHELLFVVFCAVTRPRSPHINWPHFHATIGPKRWAECDGGIAHQWCFNTRKIAVPRVEGLVNRRRGASGALLNGIGDTGTSQHFALESRGEECSQSSDSSPFSLGHSD